MSDESTPAPGLKLVKSSEKKPRKNPPAKATNTSIKVDPLGPIPVTSDVLRHRVVVTGRGRSDTRTSTLLRLREDVVAQARQLVDAPLYLLVEIALREYCLKLKALPPGTIQMIRAEDLG